MISLTVLALSLLTVLLRLAGGAKRGAIHRIADLSLVLAAAGLVIGVADAAAWGPALLFVPAGRSTPPVDPRLPSHLALLVATLVSLPACLHGIPGVRIVPAILPGVFGVALVAAASVFFGLTDAFALACVATGAFAAGVAAGTLLRGLGAPGPGRWRALLTTAVAIAGTAATLALYGHRSDPTPVRQDEAGSAAGYAFAFRGLADTSSNPVHLLVEVQQGRRLVELLPSLRREDGGRVSGRAAGGWLSGPVVAALGWRESDSEGHPFVWLGKGESVQVRGASLTFAGFRSEKGPPVRFYADLDVNQGGQSLRVSPGLAADSTGSTPFAAEIPGLGPVAVARMDADGGRVAIMMAGLEHPTGTSTATLRLQTRPGLEVAWAALVIGVLAALLTLLTPAPGERARD